MKLQTCVFAVVFVVVGIGAGYSGWKWISRSPSEAETITSMLSQTRLVSQTQAVDADEPTLVELSLQKLQKAGVTFSEVARSTLRPENLVPGRLQYDDRRHVEIRSAATGIITEIHVKPGERVQAGDILVELNSPEVGNVRADVLQRKSELKLAIESRDWQKSTCEGLKKLSEAIRSRVAVEKIREQFKNTVLGKSRDQLLSAYSELLLAESLVASAQQNAKAGIVSGRTLEERLNHQNNSEAALLAALEEQSFEATQRCRQADAQVEDAERRSRISLQTVRTLIGRSAETPTDPATPESPESDVDLQPEFLSTVKLRAPFSGTIEQRLFSTSERVAAGDAMLTLADTSTLWVAADLREREWNALSLQPGDEIEVTTSIPGLELIKALVHFVGRAVDPSTNAVPLVATIDNADGRLRPGMFVRVAVPIAESRQCLTVPEASVLEHDRQSFVFTAVGDSSFRRVNIKAGIHTAEMVEVLSGLEGGEKVVVKGSFYLKSELLLQGEAE